ncbi:hypothetical protein GXW83_16945 [Streptacidiphilus sp. PB12-B1b]|uniref:hypothetical protein n=1 Tax=Streptacidiphilus sp. PB12-B1b TaxID=2705012 RepID=UPI0015FB6F68|nr:hypothetical protein [Streptacidiphilus sp. PB12-B1b]QMU77145.1 hypothetical protein GXW83_16945 [Streptacidiphilus sp. PB12-B1b]
MTAHDPSTRVDVLLTGCDEEDADTVFHALETAFPQAEPVPGPSAQGAGRPTVWSMSLDPRTHRTGAHPESLHGPVSADLFGSPHEVHEVHAALTDAFAVEDRGAVSGDQEIEVRLRLTALSPA